LVWLSHGEDTPRRESRKQRSAGAMPARLSPDAVGSPIF
jgi:hypothetical protein